MSGRLRVDEAAGRWVLAATVGGSSLAMLDMTVVNVALEHIGRDLDAGFGSLQWIINGYTLSLAALILLGGSLGDRFGRRRVFVTGVVWFALTSALCGLAPNSAVLVAARALQGVGGALVTPGSLAIIAASFDPRDRSRAVGIWSGLGGVAGAFGPFLGGALVEWTWRAVFLVNIPLAAAVVFITLRHVPESRDPDAGRSGVDVPGAVLGVLGLASLTYTLTAAGERGADPLVITSGVVAVASLAAFVLVERHTADPLVPLSLFGDRVFRAANLITLLIYGALGVFFFLLVLQLQTVAGFSPTVAGTALLPITVLMLLLSARTGALADRIGPWVLLGIGPLLAAAGFLLTLRIGAHADYLTDVLPATVALGLGLATTVAPLTATVLAAADDHQAGAASGINNAVARSAGLLAVAVIPVLAGLGGADYTDPAVYDAGFRRAMLIGAGLLVGASLLSVLLIRPAMRAPVHAAAPPGETQPLPLAEYRHCGLAAPQLYPDAAASAPGPDR
jgi:EmrB/QacA subfamily drug resistance transporter